jgi:predicted deacetylase
MPATDSTSSRSIPQPIQALCVSIHDVAPHTWSRCQQWLQAIHAVANIPVTLLAVPNYHRYRNYNPAQFDRVLEQRLSLGDELALHGYSHLDEAKSPSTYWNRFVRNVYTQGEAEFYAIDESEAKRRLNLGIDWFNRNRWPLTGFVAPAWLMGKESWNAVREFPFKYTTTMRQFHILPERTVINTPSLVYSARNAWLKQVSFMRNGVVRRTYRHAPILRIGLHPNDVLHPDIVKNTQSLLQEFLEYRTAMTKISFTHMWQQSVRPAGVLSSPTDSYISVYCKESQQSRSTIVLQTDRRRSHVL